MSWLTSLGSDPRDWLLEGSGAGVRAAALRLLEDRGDDDPDVRAARARATLEDPIRGILAAQDPDGWWAKPGPGYAPRYRSTVWQVILLDQLRADPDDARVRAGCRYVLEHTASPDGGFGSSGVAGGPPPPARVIHCLNGNLAAALTKFGYGDDPVVRGALSWAVATITGRAGARFYREGTSGSGFACAANGGRPCAWGAIAELRAIARAPVPRDPAVQEAIDVGVEMLLSRNPVTAAYPQADPDRAPLPQWWRLGFPSGYVADLLDLLDVLADLGVASDPRAADAVTWLLDQQSAPGRWPNRRRYRSQTTGDLDPHPRASPWVTVRACPVLRAVYGD